MMALRAGRRETEVRATICVSNNVNAAGLTERAANDRIGVSPGRYKDRFLERPSLYAETAIRKQHNPVSSVGNAYIHLEQQKCTRTPPRSSDARLMGAPDSSIARAVWR